MNMTKRIFVLMAIVTLTFFISGITGCDSGSSDNKITINNDSEKVDNGTGNVDLDDGSENVNDNSSNTEECNISYERLIVNEKNDLYKIQNPWQTRDGLTPKGSVYNKIEEVSPRQTQTCDNKVLVKAKLSYMKNETEEMTFRKTTKFFLDPNCVLKDVADIFPTHTFQYIARPEESGTGDFPLVCVLYNKRPTIDDPQCDSEAHYVGLENWQWPIVQYYEENANGQGVSLDILDEGTGIAKAKITWSTGIEFLDILCDQTLIREDKKFDLRFLFNGLYAGYFKYLYTPEGYGTGDHKTMYAGHGSNF